MHGYGGDKDSWLFVHEPLAARHTVYALDLPGHGDSTKDVGAGTLDVLADAVTGFLDVLGRVRKVPSAVRRLARTLAAPGADPSTSSTRVGPRHAESTHQTPPGPPSGRTKGLCGHALVVLR
ncbi:alpha/beta fold hydrolase [Streptomyces sp. NPDC050095]|uniref:alpha/beta fold hydrolase n=1 Tax=unclassified Streptomyces TaxID=2593676 RepID=UPI003436A9B5